jgi:cytochrome c oxidase assembly protein subunit 15
MQKATVLRPNEPSASFSLQRLIQFRYLALITVIATYGLIVLGGTVRATDSGTACPDWPLCHGRVVPQFETHVMIEYSHRLAASVVGFMILAVAIWAWRRHRSDRLVMRAVSASIVLLFAQVLVGALTVNTETAASVVALHLSIALTLLAMLILVAVASLQPERREMAWSGLPALAIATALAVFALVLSGAYVSQTGAGLVYPDWPLFDGKIVSAGGKLANLHYAHRLLAAFVGAMMLALVIRTLSKNGRGPPRAIVAVALGVYVVQVLFGASNIWFDLATSVRIIHLALASALWGVLVFGVAWAHLSPDQRGA